MYGAVHRDIEITVPVQATDSVLEQLQQTDGVITITVQRGESITPGGDVIGVTALNSGADAVLRAALDAGEHGPVSVSTSTVDSLIDTEKSSQVREDHDEAVWEESETAMRRHTRPNLNLLLSTAAGGIVGTAGLAASGVTEATALVAAAVIAPVFEPLARISLALVSRHRKTLIGGLTSLLISYVSGIAAAVLTMLILRAAGPGYLRDVLHSSTVHEVEHPPLLNLLLSAAGAVAGAVMVAAGRFTVLAGPVIALQLVPALVTLGARLEQGDGTMAAHALGRVGIDIGMVLAAGLIVFTYKHYTVHNRRQARH